MANLTAGELTRLTAMTGESHKAVDERMLDDARLDEIAGEVALMIDTEGEAPYEADGTTANTLYTTTVDLYRAAAEGWREKAGMVAEGFDFRAEGASFNRSQVYDHYLGMAGRYANLAANLSPKVGSAFGLPVDSGGAWDDYLDDGGGLPA